VNPIKPRLLPSRRLLEPLVIGRLLARGLRLDPHQRTEELDAPRIERVAQCARTHTNPLIVHNRSPVTNKLARQLSGDLPPEELCRLDLLHDCQRLRLSARAR